MLSKLDNEIGFMEQGLKLRSQRQQVLATNIANVDTPNYKAQDIDFKDAMKSALSSPGTTSGMATTNNRHISGTAGGTGASLATTQPRKQLQNNADGNTVDMNVETVQFTENALQYETLVSMINGQFKNLNSVIQG
jgi:flagellar basal-body rod protein FlgB